MSDRAASEALVPIFRLIDPWSREPLRQKILSPGFGGWLRADGAGYPETDGVVRMTQPDSPRYRWVLDALQAAPAKAGEQQELSTVESFGFQWSWDDAPRTEEDLLWRVARRFALEPSAFSGKTVLDAGCGAGSQSAFLARAGARVASIDLSSAVDVAAKLPELNGHLKIEGDLARLPFENGSFDIVYCEGVLQHTRELAPILDEFFRVLRPGGALLATHYVTPKRMLGRLRFQFRNALRKRAQKLPREVLFWLSGTAAALAQTPLLGRVIGQSIAVENPRMRTFKATWSATYDSYGQHAFQRVIPHAEFEAAVRAGGFSKLDSPEGGVVRAEK